MNPVRLFSVTGPILPILYFVAAVAARGDGVTDTTTTIATAAEFTNDNDFYQNPVPIIDSDGHCICHVVTPSVVQCIDYYDPGFAERLEDAENEIARLHQILDDYNHTVHDLQNDLEELGAQLTNAQRTLDGVLDGTVIVTVSELETIQNELKEMTDILARVEAIVTDVPEIQQLREELDNITRLVSNLTVSNPVEMRMLRSKIAELKAKLAECERNYPRSDDGVFQPWSYQPTQDSCGELTSVSQPFTLRGRGATTGAWFRDPIKDSSMVWYAPFYNPSITDQMDRFANMADFSRSVRYESRHRLSSQAQGPGMVAYNGSLYYNHYRSRHLVRYNIKSRTEQLMRELPGAKFENDGGYASRGYSDIDLAVDEYGLWVIYVTSPNITLTQISRIDPDSLEVINTWTAPFSKRSVGNCFMICAKLYCISSHYSHSAMVAYIYDTTNEDLQITDIPFDNRFGQMMSLDYNPGDQKLYGWDNGHQVVYDLTFEPDVINASPPAVLPDFTLSLQ